VTDLPDTARTFSLRNLAEWAGIRDLEDAQEVLAPHLEQLTPVERGRLIADDASAVVLTTYLSYQPSWRLRPLIERIEAVAQAAAGDSVTVTGVTVVTALETERGIANLMTNLGLAILVTLGLIAFAFRRIDHGLLSLLPNVLPIVATGALLYLTGRGMQYTSVIALTVAFGVAVDDTIHFLNRLRLAASEGRGLADSVTEAGRRVGNVLILTTVVLACGLASTGLSELPTVQLFGMLCIVTLVAALASDLLLLPVLIMGPARRWLLRDRNLDRVSATFDASRQHSPPG
jgi:predicted RND superfamily exporter protein